MTSFNLDEVSKALDVSNVEEEIKGVSFENKNLKLDTVEDAKSIVEAINKCQCLEYLNLAGNTLGVAASEAVAKALENHPEFKRALWKDLFTGRLKDEIPKSLKYLGAGLVKANARLTELDLSDNAFGPIGVEGLASLLSSSSCFQLRELRLNNNGLGIGGGKLLAKALLEGHAKSSKAGAPLALRVFIAGRNRLENEGAKALAIVFATIGTLEEIAMPQNGIYHVGISALAESFAKNPQLRILNLNDNTIGSKGSVALSAVLRKLNKIQRLNFGDCLLKTHGAISLATALHSLPDLEEVLLDYNEIQRDGGVKIASALSGKQHLKTLGLDGNMFNEEARRDIENALGASKSALQPMDNNESACEDETEESESEEEEQSDEDEEEIQLQQNGDVKTVPEKAVTITEFLTCPTGDRLLGLGAQAGKLLLDEAQSEGETDSSTDQYLNTYIPVLMKVCALAGAKDVTPEVTGVASKCSEHLFRCLFEWRSKDEQRSPLTDNALCVHLGLIKSEERKYRPPWDTSACIRAVQTARKFDFFPKHTAETIDLFISNNQPQENVK